MNILCLNAGSSSLKFAVFSFPEAARLAQGAIENIGPEARIWVRNVQDQSIIAYAYALGHCSYEFTPRSTHAKTSARKPRFPRPVFDASNFRPAEAPAVLQT